MPGIPGSGNGNGGRVAIAIIIAIGFVLEKRPGEGVPGIGGAASAILGGLKGAMPGTACPILLSSSMNAAFNNEDSFTNPLFVLIPLMGTSRVKGDSFLR